MFKYMGPLDHFIYAHQLEKAYLQSLLLSSSSSSFFTLSLFSFFFCFLNFSFSKLSCSSFHFSYNCNFEGKTVHCKSSKINICIF